MTYYSRLVEKEIELKLRTLGAASLKTLKKKIEEKSDEQSPSFLMVLTAVGGSYQREDGVYVVPINLLRP